jgi:hypothetical protein
VTCDPDVDVLRILIRDTPIDEATRLNPVSLDASFKNGRRLLPKVRFSESRAPDIPPVEMSAFYVMTAPGWQTSDATLSQERPHFCD